MNKLIKVVQWRWVSILILGVTANFVINWIFDFRHPIETFQWNEYLVAIGLSAMLLESIRFANRRISQSFSIKKFRIPIILLIDLAIVILLVDGMGTIYMMLLYGDTYSSQEYGVINMVTLILVAIISLIDQLLQKEVKNDNQTVLIPTSYAGSKKWIKPEDIEFCYLDQSLSYIVCDKDRFISEHSLSELSDLLPERYFRLNRQFILNPSMIDRTRSAAFGKVEVFTVQHPFLPKKLVVSRKRASGFRRWLKHYSTSSHN